ncbi:hypothetical protein PHAVU_001G068900 [Phaseolus vulgaris]|uniref:Uncharacterized protein n=1 Tax=Phaseolus vulgaris TaxID=3885 RepID=V7CTG6_PHAVU|nr:hypothetical protein PHAVU_001G068900g [Phaseolus vulgaris]ESW33434.1 hypothetical protein PHAVU_001G068900g [Phaseolus vulgaris]
MGCLMDQEVFPIKKVFFIPGQRKTFAQALGNTCDIPFSQLPTPCIMGDMVVVRVDEEDYFAGLEDCKTHLHGWIILSKGDKHLTHLDFTKKLQLVWKVIRSWKAIFLGKGFYEFEFSSLEDIRVLKTQTWVRIYHLPLKYWRPRAIFSITRGIGIPLSLDDHTMRKNRCLFARVFVDIDLLSPFPDQLLVERSDFSFVTEVEYEWLPPLCSYSKMIGHELAQCHVIHDQGHVFGPQHKPSQKTTPDEQE